MTLEIIIFIIALLFGIIWYWRESKNNKVYRWLNRISNTKTLQMTPENRKGFIHEQSLLIRLVYITLLFAVTAGIISFVTPINAFYIQYFASAIVATLLGTYIASAFLFAQKKTKKENLEKVLQKGKDMVDDFTENIKKEVQPEPAETPTKLPEPEGEPKKSARDRFKDKGMIQ